MTNVEDPQGIDACGQDPGAFWKFVAGVIPCDCFARPEAVFPSNQNNPFEIVRRIVCFVLKNFYFDRPMIEVVFENVSRSFRHYGKTGTARNPAYARFVGRGR